MTYATDGTNHQKPFPAFGLIFDGKLIQESFADYKAVLERIEVLRCVSDYKTGTFLVVKLIARSSVETVYRAELKEFR